LNFLFFASGYMEHTQGNESCCADEVRAVPLFSTLPEADLERLAQTSADVHLGAGEFAVHEGENVRSTPSPLLRRTSS
jgi:hypothetical protein